MAFCKQQAFRVTVTADSDYPSPPHHIHAASLWFCLLNFFLWFLRVAPLFIELKKALTKRTDGFKQGESRVLFFKRKIVILLMTSFCSTVDRTESSFVIIKTKKQTKPKQTNTKTCSVPLNVHDTISVKSTSACRTDDPGQDTLSEKGWRQIVGAASRLCIKRCCKANTRPLVGPTGNTPDACTRAIWQIKAL